MTDPNETESPPDLSRPAVQQRAATGFGVLPGPTGPPEGRKSTGLETLRNQPSGGGVLVPMNGYGLIAAERPRRGLPDLKGSLETVAARGFLAPCAPTAWSTPHERSPERYPPTMDRRCR